MQLHLALVFLAAFAVGENDIKYEDDVMVLTTANFDAAISENKYVLVEFYAPWCGHCKALAPEYAKAAAQLKAAGAEAKLAKVDATVEKKLGENHKVDGFPTIKFFNNGVASDYEGGRKAADIVNWLNKKTGPPTQLLATNEDAKALIAGEDVVVIGFFPDPASESSKTYTTVAEGLDDVVFGHITDENVAKALDISENGIVMFRKFDEPRLVYAGKMDEQEIDDFIKGNQLPLVSEFTEESAPKIFGGSITVHNLLFMKKSDDSFAKIYEDYKTAAAEFRGKVLFVLVDADIEDNERVLEFFNLKAEDCPDYRVVKMDQDMAKFKAETKDLSADAIIAFTAQVVSGEAQRHLNSEQIPEDWNKNPVHVLVGKNFQEVALDPNKKVFVEFYAPWCGHCKQLAPIWDKLGEKYADRDDIIVAKMDATANEVEDFQVQGFPTIKYFPDDKMENVIDYDGERTLDAMVKFIDSDGKEVVGGGDDDDEDEDDEDLDDEDGYEDVDDDDQDSDDDDDDDAEDYTKDEL